MEIEPWSLQQDGRAVRLILHEERPFTLPGTDEVLRREPVTLTIDLVMVVNITSALIAWMLSLRKTVPEVPITLVGCSRANRIVLEQVGVAHFFAYAPGPHA